MLLVSLTRSNESLAHLRTLLLGALFFLLVLGAWLALVVYRQLITPLNVRLIESQALLEHQNQTMTRLVGAVQELSLARTLEAVMAVVRRRNARPKPSRAPPRRRPVAAGVAVGMARPRRRRLRPARRRSAPGAGADRIP